MNTSQLLVKCLENEGVEYIFGIPGEEMVYFLDALKDSTIQFITTADERGASFMAAAYGRLTGRSGVVAATLGPGALNIPNGLAFATLSGFPLVALTWQSGFRENSKDNGFQYVDIEKVLSPVSKSNVSIADPKQTPQIVRNAFRISQTPKKGSCHIQIYEDVAKAAVSNVSTATISRTGGTVVDQDTIKKAAHLILRSENPVILAGLRSSNESTAFILQQFVRETDIKLATTPMAQGILSHDGPHSLGTFVNGAVDFTHQIFAESDLVIVVGYDPIEYSPGFWNRENTPIVSIDSVQSKVLYNFNPEMELVGDIESTVISLSKELKNGSHQNSSNLKIENSNLENAKNYEKTFPIDPRYLISVLSENSDDTLFVHDNGMHKLWMTKYFRHTFPNQVLIDNTLASMGSGIPQAMVAKLINTEKKIVVNVGDGGFMMSMGELVTAATLDLPLVVLVWNDGGYGMIRWHQEKNNLDNFGVDLKNPDYLKIAESFGGAGVRIESASDLEPALQNALDGNRLTIIDCPIDYSRNHEEFKNKKSKNIVVKRSDYVSV